VRGHPTRESASLAVRPTAENRREEHDGEHRLRTRRDARRVVAVAAGRTMEDLRSPRPERGHDVLEVGERRGDRTERRGAQGTTTPRHYPEDEDPGQDLQLGARRVPMRDAITGDVEQRSERYRRDPGTGERTGRGAGGDVQGDDHGSLPGTGSTLSAPTQRLPGGTREARIHLSLRTAPDRSRRRGRQGATRAASRATTTRQRFFTTPTQPTPRAPPSQDMVTEPVGLEMRVRCSRSGPANRSAWPRWPPSPTPSTRRPGSGCAPLPSRRPVSAPSWRRKERAAGVR
jgi:hypothetical protein